MSDRSRKRNDYDNPWHCSLSSCDLILESTSYSLFVSLGQSNVSLTRSPDFDVFQAVYKDAERISAEIARAYKMKQSESSFGNNESIDLVGQERDIANWDWLDFGDTTELDQ